MNTLGFQPRSTTFSSRIAMDNEHNLNLPRNSIQNNGGLGGGGQYLT